MVLVEAAAVADTPGGFDVDVPGLPGTDGDYRTTKVANVFPALWRSTS